MNSPKRPLTYQKILFSKLIGIPLTVMAGFTGGVACAGQVWLKSGFELVPTEMVLTPPPQNATWCFPDIAFTGAERFKVQLVKQLAVAHSVTYSDTILAKSTQAVFEQDELGRKGYYQLRVLAVTPKRFAVLAMPQWETNPSRYTLITEQGSFYLHAIPKRKHEKYDSLASARLGYQK
jgi:hypothetical protein